MTPGSWGRIFASRFFPIPLNPLSRFLSQFSHFFDELSSLSQRIAFDSPLPYLKFNPFCRDAKVKTHNNLILTAEPHRWTREIDLDINNFLTSYLFINDKQKRLCVCNACMRVQIVCVRLCVRVSVCLFHLCRVLIDN